MVSLSPSPPGALSVEFVPAEQLIVVRWAGTCDRALLHSTYERVVDLLRRTGAHRVLFDTREREIIGPDDARWVASEAYLAMLQARRWTQPLRLAYAVPETVFRAFPPHQTQTSGELLHIGMFRSPEVARAWLLAA